MRRDLDALANTGFDILVIGGGIYGGCIAWEAASRGLAVALVDQGDFGHATSANSLKVVHGGLRYLQNMDFKRMRESIRERTVLMRIAPHLVHPMPCLMPTYGHLTHGREVMLAALKINDLVSFDRNRLGDPDRRLPESRLISRAECLRILPGLPDTGLNGGAIWYDCQMHNSERLTLAFIMSAANRGACVANYVQVVEFIEEPGRLAGARVRDALSGVIFDIRADIVVNAAGPWVDHVLRLVNQRNLSLGVRLAKALNVGTRQLLAEYALGLYSPPKHAEEAAYQGTGRRVYFAVPWQDQSLIGTAYTAHEAGPETFEVSAADVQALLAAINQSYPPAALGEEDVRHIYAGLVPIEAANTRAGDVKRASHYRIRDHRQDGVDGLVSVLGVKYTTARDVAEKVVDQLFLRQGKKPPASTSAHTPLVGGDIDRLESYLTAEANKQPFGLTDDQVRSLIYDYGSAYSAVLRYFEHCPDGKNLDDSAAVFRAQVLYGVRHEMAQRLSDIVSRRTAVGSHGQVDAALIRLAAAIMGEELGWNAARIQAEIAGVDQLLTGIAPQRITV
jgi:glycerol-3-phosphate dehydrogenase